MNRERDTIGTVITLVIIAIVGFAIWRVTGDGQEQNSSTGNIYYQSAQSECQATSPNVDSITGYGGVAATINGYDFQYRASGAACSKNQTNTALESNVVNTVMESR